MGILIYWAIMKVISYQSLWFCYKGLFSFCLYLYVENLHNLRKLNISSVFQKVLVKNQSNKLYNISHICQIRILKQ